MYGSLCGRSITNSYVAVAFEDDSCPLLLPSLAAGSAHPVVQFVV